MTSAIDRARARRSAGRLVLGVRSSLLALCLGLAVFSDNGAAALPFLAAIAAVAAVDSLVPLPVTASRSARVLEVVVCAVGIVISGGDTSPLLAYLLAPAFAGGLADGVEGAVIPAGIAAIVLLFGRLMSDERALSLREYTAASAEWTVIAVLVGLLAAWVRRLRRAAEEGAHEQYRQAYRLLTQLRSVTRRLPSSLDPVGVASSLLRQCYDLVPYFEGAVLIHTAGDRLAPLALERADRLGFEPSLGRHGPLATAWRTQGPVVEQNWSPDESAEGAATLLVVPLLVADRAIGLVTLRTDTGVDGRALDDVAAVCQQAALPLETTLLFDDIRAIATAEERQRLAREIHDGIAQELVYVGYQVDDVLAESRGSRTATTKSLRHLRDEISRVINELRLSIFELRSSVDTHAGLGTTLSEHVRTVGTSTGLTVHLSLNESSVRLPADTEVELLRIAQEAVNNARKHAHARNLWVSLDVDPPHARLRVEDDGDGIGVDDARSDTFGLQIMSERASRLRATFDVLPRPGGGTRVEVAMGGRPA